MAATVALITGLPQNPIHIDENRVALANVTGDTSYPTGGYALGTPAVAIGMNDVNYVDPQPAIAGTNYAVWDTTNAKLKIFVSSTGAEVANTTNVSTSVFPCTIYGH